MLSGMVVRDFFTFHVLAERTPAAGKSQSTGILILGHFGLGQPLTLGEILGGKQKNANSHIETEKRETKTPSAGS